ncbi:tetratricopeptide repeat protein [Thermodesulfobacteriota bacterium]
MLIRNNHAVLHITVIITASVFFIPFSPCFGNTVLIIDADRQFKFAEKSFSDGDYSLAIDEYKRFIHFFPADDRVELAMYNIGLSYFEDQRFKAAIDAFNSLIDKYENTALAIQSYFRISESQEKLPAFGPAITTLQNLATLADDVNVRDEAYYRTGWIYVETGAWEKARRSFDKISEQNRNKYMLKRLSDELDTTVSIPKKSPGLAGILSVIPGAGFLYCGRYQDALIAFLLNGGLIYAAYESFDEELYALGGIISFVELGFYTGNIYGAVNSAHKYNRSKTRQFIENLKLNSKISLSPAPKNGFILSFQYRF